MKKGKGLVGIHASPVDMGNGVGIDWGARVQVGAGGEHKGKIGTTVIAETIKKCLTFKNKNNASQNQFREAYFPNTYKHKQM